MNAYENALQESLENIQITPGEALRSRVMSNAVNGIDTPYFYRRRIPVRIVVIAAIIATLIFTTAAAYGNELVSVIRQLVFGDSIATQIEDERDPDGFGALGSYGVMNRADLDAKDYPLGFFNTLEEARQAAPFYIKEPAFLPECVDGLHSVGVWRAESPDVPWLHFVTVNYNVPLENGGNTILMLKQTYGGPDAYITVDTVFPIDRVMIGDIEALCISDIDYNNSGIILWWMKDGIAYELDSGWSDNIDLDAMIAIAESIS